MKNKLIVSFVTITFFLVLFTLFFDTNKKTTGIFNSSDIVLNNLVGLSNDEKNQIFKYELEDGDKICDAVKSNKSLKIYIKSYYDNKNYLLKSPADKCDNSKETRSSSFTVYGRLYSSKEVYSDSTLVKQKGEIGKYSPFYISDKSTYLKPGERLFLELDVSNQNITSDSIKDLRFKIDYEAGTGYTFEDSNAISYYVITDKKTYGPYKSEFSDLVDVINVSGTSIKKIRRISSYNLISDIPKNTKIKTIKIVPFESYDLHDKYLIIYKLGVYGYKEKYNGDRDYTTLASASNIYRHNIVNNMIENATIKWNRSSSSPNINFYSHISSSPLTVSSNINEFKYGVPYVNNVDITLDAFIARSTKNNVTSSNKKSIAYYSFNYPNKYVADATSSKIIYDNDQNNDKTIDIKKDSKVGNTLYVFEKFIDNDNNPKKTPRYNDLRNIKYAPNNKYYVLGLDCSSSTYLANARELPYNNSMAGSNKYYSSYSVRFLTGNNSKYNIDFTPTKLEEYLRKNNILKKDQEFTNDIYTEYYSTYFKNNYKEALYNSFGLAIPGDILASRGHVRMITGYSYVMCNDGKHYTKKYKDNEGFCDKYKGIDPKKSYVITSEIGSFSTTKANHVTVNEAGWSINIDKNLTDLAYVDELYNNNFTSSFSINTKYTFEDLLKPKNIYVPFRYIALDNVASNKIEKPNVNILLDKNYENINQGFINRLADYKKLQGTIISNYLIREVQVIVNGTTYKFYPMQTNNFSLFSAFDDVELINKIANLDYSKTQSIKVIVRTGTSGNDVNNSKYDLSSVNVSGGLSKDGYITLIDTTGLVGEKTSISFKDKTINLNVGATVTLSPTLKPTIASGENIIWSSSGKKVATVDSNGIVKGIKAGKVTITATAKDTKASSSIVVNVIEPVKSITSSETSFNLDVGKTKKINYTISPSNASDKTVTFKSSNTKVATVDTSGNVKGVAAGETNITVTTKSESKTVTIKVKVVKPTIKVTGVSLNKKSTTINVKAKETLVATIKPSNSTNKNVTWSSSNTKVATVSSDGVVTGVKAGSATITVKTVDGEFTSSCTVKVVTPKVNVTSVKVNKTEASLKTGNKEKIVATITPDNATNKEVIWTSSNDKVAIVDGNGEITAIGEGNAVISAISADNNSLLSTINVNVEKTIIEVTNIILNSSRNNLDVGECEEIVSNVVPSDATNREIIWTSSNNEILEVDNNGKVCAKSEGTAKVIAKSNNNKSSEILFTINKENNSNVEVYDDPQLIDDNNEDIVEEDIDEDIVEEVEKDNKAVEENRNDNQDNPPQEEPIEEEKTNEEEEKEIIEDEIIDDNLENTSEEKENKDNSNPILLYIIVTIIGMLGIVFAVFRPFPNIKKKI